MKPLSPALREKKRYIAFELVSEEAITRHDLISEIWSSAGSLLGDIGRSECGLWMLSFDGKQTKEDFCARGIIRCAAERTWESRAALATVNSVRRTRVAIRVLGISGTVKEATEKYMLQTEHKGG